MTIKQYMKENGWQVACASKPCRYMNVDINFLNNSKLEDETQFSIRAYDIDDLAELFEAFCKENGFKKNTVTSVTIVQMADTRDELD